MPGFVITAVFVLDGGPAGGKVPLGPDVLAIGLQPGHRFSYGDGRTLSVVLELVAADDAAAFETALTRIEAAWTAAGGGGLPAPTTLRLQRAVPPEQVTAGQPGSKRSKAARTLRYFSPEQDPLQRALSGMWPPGPGDGDGPDGPDDDPDDGGLAGVREPRRPSPGPGHLCAQAPLPPPPVL